MQIIDMSKYGDCIGAMQFGTSVQFWCKSLDGGVTDSRQVTLTFKNEATAAAIASLTVMETPTYAINWKPDNTGF